MTFTSDPGGPREPGDPGQPGQPGQSGDPGDGARMTRVEEINQEVGSLVDQMVTDERLARGLAARRASHIDRIRRLTLERNRLTVPAIRRDGWDFANTAIRETATEIAHALLISEKVAKKLIVESETLVYDLPDTHTALFSGELSYQHAAVIAKESWFLPDECLPAFEQSVIPEAATKTVPRFRERVKIIRERIHPVSLEVRHERALRERAVFVDNGPDGMATLTYTDSAEKVIPIYNRIDKTARALRGPNEQRTLPELRADALGDLGLNGTPSPEYDKGVTPTVLIAVPVLTAMGEGSEPAMMEGYGPIDPETARRLAARAPSFYRILTHPETGAILSLGRTTYRVPADLRRFVRLRDGTCRGGVGCPTPAEQCDIDHTEEWQDGGETDAENLAHLCRSHHSFKSYSAWTVVQIGGGRLEWTSPSGKKYITEPSSFIGPMPFTMPELGPAGPIELPELPELPELVEPGDGSPHERPPHVGPAHVEPPHVDPVEADPIDDGNSAVPIDPRDPFGFPELLEPLLDWPETPLDWPEPPSDWPELPADWPEPPSDGPQPPSDGPQPPSDRPESLPDGPERPPGVPSAT
ncbi:HNH endonuclease signature motif containing protein [Glaciihabitans sp. dw_435]|uniref:HNH endonuclease n=1 Tax=Glaciihabitans sp. dw_435 TaxID=2720081 RepID=UPI001BD69B15|nr:HNH endonuclease signature motif containing protein [Glaciihabitans sp. dw_435]